MNAQDLKNSILQLAVQGKLVEQRPEEGTAKELLAQIKAEKEQLIKDKKIKKEKPLPEITDEEKLFEIPESWEWLRLGNFLSINSGKNLTSKEMIDGGIPVYGGNGITGYHNEANIEKETVVIGRVGFYCGSVHVTPEKAWVTDNAFITTYTEQSIDREYLIYVLRHLNLGKSNNATAQPVVSGKKIYPILFPVPPLDEQKRIVAKIEEILPYIQQYDKAYTKLEAFNKKFPEDMKKSILQMAMQGKLVEQRPEEGTADELYEQIVTEKTRLIKEGKIKKEKPLAEISEDEIPFEIPQSWKWVRLSEIVMLQNGDRSSKYPVESDYVDFGIPFFGAKDMGAKYMSYENVRYISEKKFTELGNGKLLDGDFVCLLRGSVGKVAVYKTDERHKSGFICAQMVILRSFDSDLIDYLYLALTSPYYFKMVEKKTTGTAIRQLPAKDLGNIRIPLPPLAEQKRIVAKLEQMMPYCDRLIK